MKKSICHRNLKPTPFLRESQYYDHWCEGHLLAGGALPSEWSKAGLLIYFPSYCPKVLTIADFAHP